MSENHCPWCLNPTTNEMSFCPNCGWKLPKGVNYSDHTDYDKPKNYVTWTEPQTEPTKAGTQTETQNSNLTFEKVDCGWK